MSPEKEQNTPLLEGPWQLRWLAAGHILCPDQNKAMTRLLNVDNGFQAKQSL